MRTFSKPRLSPLQSVFATGLATALAAACYDPVHLDAVANLGPETPGIPPGPTHRASQPCSTCHGGDGPAETELTIAGTLYQVRGDDAPLVDGVVTVTDARGEARSMRSNAAGNFFLTEREWAPVFPLHVVLEAEGIRREMVTTIGRDGSCATCHRGDGDGDRTRMPGVYLRDR
jgi:cytochrome c553